MNHITNYLTFCVNHSVRNNLYFFKDIEVFDENKNKINVEKGSLVKVNSFKQNENSNYVLFVTLTDQKKSITFEFD